MDTFSIIAAVVLLLILVGVAIYATRAMRARQIRQAEQRRPVDKGKHVEL